MSEPLYITGAGVSASSGIPTFRGQDGFWTVGSNNYTPQEMATRYMYKNHTEDFLLWYFLRFAKYRNASPNSVHYWLSNKKLITQNIDGLDGKAGNKNYIPIHGRLDKITLFHDQGETVELIDAPWKEIAEECPDINDTRKLKHILLDYFKISKLSKKPEKYKSLKPFVLLFDEYYTNIYRMHEAEKLMVSASEFVFIGTSFNVNITDIALKYALQNNAKITVIDKNPVNLGFENVIYKKMTAENYIENYKY